MNACLMKMQAELFEERTVFKIWAPARVEWIGLCFDFQVPSNDRLVGQNQLQPNDLTIRGPLADIRRKPSSSSTQWVPVLPQHPIS